MRSVALLTPSFAFALLLFGLVAPSGAQMPVDPFGKYPCCNTQTGEWIGDLTMTECLMKPGHASDVPGVPQLAEMADACRDDEGGDQGGGSGGGGGSYEEEPVWETFEENIPNGDFETWQGEKPADFATFSNEAMERERYRLADWETVFRSDDALTGETAILLRNHQPDPFQLTQEANIPALALQYLKKLVLAAGFVSCHGCAIETGNSIDSAESELDRMSFPIEEPGNYLCGGFKPELKGGDQLMVSIVIMEGGEAIGGATAADVLTARLSKHEDGWIKFKLPIFKRPGMERRVPDRGVLQLTVLPSGGLGVAGAFPDPESESLVDSLHLCGDTDLRIADAESSGGRIIENEDEKVGAVVFPNLDNDDEDAHFDPWDPDGVTGGDDDLAELRLRVPGGAKGKVTLKLDGDEERVKLWTAKAKTPSDAYADLGKAVELPADFEAAGQYLEKVLWIEGVEPSEKTSDLVFELLYEPESAHKVPEKDRVALTVLAVEDLRWLGKDRNSEKDGNDLGCDPNHPLNTITSKPLPGGKVEVSCTHPSDDEDHPVRVFPGARYKNGQKSGGRRDRVELEVTLNVKPPHQGIPLFLRSFDVDDPTAESDEVDDESAAEDNRTGAEDGEVGKAGKFPAGEIDDLLRLDLPPETTAKVLFQVSMQPGDNFRVAVSPDRDFAEALENDDTQIASPEDRGRIVDPRILDENGSPRGAAVRDADQWVSDTLTVWRFLHVERDSMTEVAKNTLSGQITGITPVDGTADRFAFATNVNIVKQRPPSVRGNIGQWNSFDGGRLDTASGPFNVVGNTAHSGGTDSLTIADPTGWLKDPKNRASLVNTTFQLQDDDRKPKATRLVGEHGEDGVFVDGDPIPLPPGERLEQGHRDAYRPAYVHARLDTIPTGPASRVFLGNIEKDTQDYVRTVLFRRFDQKQNEDDRELWTVYLLGAFQGVHWQDADGEHCAPGEESCQAADGKEFKKGPVGGVAGEADGAGGHGALIYWASGAELERSKGNARGWRVIDASAHEIGHLFGGEHEDEGLMSDGEEGRPDPTEHFSPKTLAKIRNARHP